MKSIDPSTGEIIARHEALSEQQLQERLARAAEAFRDWRRRALSERCALLEKLAALTEERRDKLAETITREMGKPITQARQEIERCAWLASSYAKRTSAHLAPQQVSTDASRSYVAFQPLGGVLGIMPWNFPIWQTFRYAIPSLAAGNVALLKPAPNVMGCAQQTAKLLSDAGFPVGAFSLVPCAVEQVEALIAHSAVAAVTVTGSSRAGAEVAKRAGAALKKTVLELGGSDPYVVLADADVARAAEVAVEARMDNSGQSCVAGKRFIVVEALREPFERRVVALMDGYEMAPPLHPNTRLGPMARADLRDEVHRQVTESLAAGARLLTGGEIPDRPGFWYPATALAEVAPCMPAYDEEIFGPVAAIIRASDDDDAIRIANDTGYGLGAAVFTTDLERGRRIAEEQLEAGCCFVNAAVRSHPDLPFGGVKRSGYGRELSSFGIREFVNIKTVWID